LKKCAVKHPSTRQSTDPSALSCRRSRNETAMADFPTHSDSTDEGEQLAPGTSRRTRYLAVGLAVVVVVAVILLHVTGVISA
jgi:hypothetical protein